MILNMLISGAEKFLTEWPEQPVLEQHDPAVFEYLLTRSDVDELIDNDCLSRKYLAVVRGGVITDSREYVPQDSQMPRRGSIRRFYNEGCTISLRGVQELRPAVAKLCAEVGAATGYPTHANAYYTPPGTCGLRYHWDSYVTLVVQLSGTKAWPVHPPMVPNTTREYLSFTETGFTDGQLTYLANTPPREYVLRPGDVFWLPRGWVHAPHAIGDGPSLHLTIGIKQRTLHWLASELAGEVLAQALIDPELRSEATPAQLLGGGPAVDEMRKYLIGALLRMKPDEAAEVVRSAALKPVRRHAPTRPRPSELLGKPPTMPMQDEVRNQKRHKNDINWDVYLQGEPASGIHFHGFTWKGPAARIFKFTYQPERTLEAARSGTSDTPPEMLVWHLHQRRLVRGTWTTAAETATWMRQQWDADTPTSYYINPDSTEWYCRRSLEMGKDVMWHWDWPHIGDGMTVRIYAICCPATYEGEQIPCPKPPCAS